MGVGRAQHRGIGLPRLVEVIAIAALPGQQCLVLASQYRLTNAGHQIGLAFARATSRIHKMSCLRDIGCYVRVRHCCGSFLKANNRNLKPVCEVRDLIPARYQRNE